MRPVLRTAVIALASSPLLAGAVFAARSASAAGTITVTAPQLGLQPDDPGYTGYEVFTIHNGTDQQFQGSIAVTEPIIGTAKLTGPIWPGTAGGCMLGPGADQRITTTCGLAAPIAAGADATVVVPFASVAKPQAASRIAPQPGRIEVTASGESAPVASADFAAVLEGFDNQGRDPLPYAQDTAADLRVTAGSVQLKRQSNGTYAGTGELIVRNNGDAPLGSLQPAFTLPAGVSVSAVEGATCTGSACAITTAPIAQGSARAFGFTLTSAAGRTGTAKVTVGQSGPATAQTGGANTASFAVTR